MPSPLVTRGNNVEHVTGFGSDRAGVRAAERFAKANDHMGYVHAGAGEIVLDPSRVKEAPKLAGDLMTRSQVDKAIADAVAAALAASKVA